MKVEFRFILDIEGCDDRELQHCIESAEELAQRLGCAMADDDRQQECWVRLVGSDDG